MRRGGRPDNGPARQIRCAIYTRKSTEEGLEQEFNSLDAQKEACAAYVTSQRHEGWALIPGDYDDGGFSGGTLERPALKRLLAEISAGRIDVIVVYKVDRLTRSLGDFSRIVDVLDEAPASFVSVTQAFNTTTSMGRLTLNVLLSFAQFEREVTGERIRDKIAQSKARGMWMGGVVPLGYRVEARKLLIDETEAETVRFIMRRYLELGSVSALHEDLCRQGIRGRARILSGELVPPKEMSRGALSLLLTNRIYCGEITHKGKSYPGEHQGIVTPELFDQVHALLVANRNNHHVMTGVSNVSLLAGILWDAHGRKMSPSHSVKSSVRRYRYYCSRTDGPAKDRPVWRVPAGDLEALVVGRVRALLLDEGQLLDSLGNQELDTESVHTLMFEARRLADRLVSLPAGELRQTIIGMLSRVELHATDVRIVVRWSAVQGLAGDHTVGRVPGSDIELKVPATLARIGREMKLVVPAAISTTHARRDPSLIKLIVKAHAARAALEAHDGRTVEELAKAQGHDRDYFGVLLRLSYFPPGITSAILEGAQPARFTRQLLVRSSGQSLGW